MTQIANPIYDAVFKFMMNDNNVAKLLLSAIIGEEIQELVFQPTDLNIPLQESITVLRMDFKAIIKLPDGTTKTAIIEIQKAKLHTDIMRFRKYLGEQYRDKNNSEIIKKVASKTKEGTWIEHHKAYPILSIYFLGHPLDKIRNVPVINVKRAYYDLGTGEELLEREDFIESLTHDSYVIQIPYIADHKRTELEKLLQIFDQEETKDDNLKHILTVKEAEIPKKYRSIIRRLRLAIADAATRELMEAEDDLIFELKQYARAVTETIKERDEAIKEVKEREKTIEEKESQIRQNQDIAILAMLKNTDLKDEEIANALTVAIERVQQLRKSIS